MLNKENGKKLSLIIIALILLPGILILSPILAQDQGRVWVVNSDIIANDEDPGDGVCDTGTDEFGVVCNWLAVVQEINALGGVHTIAFSIDQVTVSSTFEPFDGPTQITIDGGEGPPVEFIPHPEEGLDLEFGFTVSSFHVRNIWMKGPDPNAGITSQGIITEALDDGGSIKDCIIEDSFFTGDFRFSGLRIGIPAGPASGCEIKNNWLGFDPDGNPDPNFLGGIEVFGDNILMENNTISQLHPSLAEVWTRSAIWFVANNSEIKGNMIGTDPSGTQPVGNPSGIYLVGNENNLIENVVSASRKSSSLEELDENNMEHFFSGTGIIIIGDYNDLYMNRIGTDISGMNKLGNENHGVVVLGNFNCIGTLREYGGGKCISSSYMDSPQEANVISANGGYGIAIINWEDSYFFDPVGLNNTILWNTIGLDLTQRQSLGNGMDGIFMGRNTQFNDIRQNTIAANGENGIEILGNNHFVHQNYIGHWLSEPDITQDLGNNKSGVWIEGSSNIIGGILRVETGFLPNNVISGNGGDGIHIETSFGPGIFDAADRNQILGNYIGVDSSGRVGIPNDGNGIYVFGDDTIIGEPSTGTIRKYNVISGNNQSGILIESGSSNKIYSNYIGIQSPQQTQNFVPKKIPNNGSGIILDLGSFGNDIGGRSDFGNIIVGNDWFGVEICSNCDSNLVDGNRIGIFEDSNGNWYPLPNGLGGLVVEGDSNLIGGPSGELNIISANEGPGVVITGNNNKLLNNTIGDPDTNPETDFGNDGPGVIIEGNDNFVTKNKIGENKDHGIVIWKGAEKNEIFDNDIGVVRAFLFDLPRPIPNIGSGVFIADGANLNIIEQNWIAFNKGDGVRVDGSSSIRNTITVNSIFANDGEGIENINGGNIELLPPVGSIIDTGQVESLLIGNTCANCIVEIFSDPEGEGGTFEESIMADNTGRFELQFDFVGPMVTCTATDEEGNTSEFGCGLESAPRFLVTKRDTDVNGGDLLAGDVLEYKLEIVNGIGRSFIDGATNELEDKIPDNTRYLTGSLRIDGALNDDNISDGVGFNTTGNQIIWNGPILSGEHMTVTFRVQVDSMVENGTVISNQGIIRLDADGDGILDVDQLTDDPDTPEINDPTISNVRTETINGVKPELIRETLQVSAVDRSFSVLVEGNTNIANLVFDDSQNELRYIAEGLDGDTGFSNVTIPKALMNGTFSVFIDTELIAHTESENIAHTSLYFSFQLSSRTVTIASTTEIIDSEKTIVDPVQTTEQPVLPSEDEPEIPYLLIVGIIVVGLILGSIVLLKRRN